MSTIQRERYQAALAHLEEVQHELTRQEMLYQVLLNRLRQADVEGYEAEADQIEQRGDAMVSQIQAEQQHVDQLQGQARELRVLATVEEIDEVTGDYDAALHAILDRLGALTAVIQQAAGLAERVANLAADLPPEQRRARRTAWAAQRQATTLRDLARQLGDVLTASTLPSLPSSAQAEPDTRASD
jgi:hypothetical protein